MKTWITRLTGIAALLFVTGPLLASIGLVPPLAGFVPFGLGGILALVSFVVGLVGLARGNGNLLSLVVAAILSIVFVVAALPGRRVPRINDISTDVANPPEFVHAPTLPGNVGRDMKYPGPSFADQQKAGYPDLRPLHLDVAVEDAFKKVLAAVKQLPGTEITATDAGAHRIEAVTTSRLFRFQDDFVVEVRADANGSVIQMRSKSRVGKGDVGANAKRIQDVFELIQKAP